MGLNINGRDEMGKSLYGKYVKEKEDAVLWIPNADTKDASKCFTINTTANGIALTGDDKHNAIYLPKVAIPELVKALMDFI